MFAILKGHFSVFYRLMLLSIFFVFYTEIVAQTPYANRIKAKISMLPTTSKVVAKFTDTKRHCVYYIANNRLYLYDVKQNKEQEVNFCTGGYDRIKNVSLINKADFLLIEIVKEVKEKQTKKYETECWTLNSFTHSYTKYQETKDPLDSSETLKQLKSVVIKHKKHASHKRKKHHRRHVR